MSGIPTYPIPHPPPDDSQVEESLTLQGEKLRGVLTQLAQEVTGGLEQQQKAIDKVTSALRRRIQTSLRGQVKLLTPLMDAIHGTIAGSLAAQQVALATLMDQPVYQQVSGATVAAGSGYQVGPQYAPVQTTTAPVTSGPLPVASAAVGAAAGAAEPLPATYPVAAQQQPAEEAAAAAVSAQEAAEAAVDAPHEPVPDWPSGVKVLPDWCSMDVCQSLPNVTALLSGLPERGGLIGAIFGGAGASDDPVSLGPVGWLGKQLTSQSGKAVTEWIRGLLEWVEDQVHNRVTGLECSPAQVSHVWATRAALGFVEKWLGIGLEGPIQSLTYWIDSYCPTTIPSTAEANACYLGGTVTEEQWDCWVRANGHCPEPQKRVVSAQRQRPDVGQELALWLRQAQTDAELGTRLRGLGVLDGADLDRFKALTLQLPTPTELVQWVVREAFDLDVVRRWGYDQERPDIAAPYFHAQGLYGEYPRVGTETKQRDSTDHLGMTWAAHWQPIAPGQAYSMLHRVRPDTVDELRAFGLDVEPFTIKDVQYWLKIADYPKGIRDYLIATAFAPLRLLDIRNGLILGVRDKQWAYGQFLSRGLSPQNAQFAADLAERQAADKFRAPVIALERKALTWFVQEVQDGYELGTIDRRAAEEVLVSAGLSGPAAMAALDARDSRARRKLVNRAVSSVRRDYLSGAISQAEAAQALNSAGIQPDQGNRYLELWSVELGHARRVASTQKTIAWLTEGLITRDDAVRRLSNLGWSNPDIMTYLAEAQLKVSKQQAALLRAQAATDRQAAKQLESLQRRAQSTADRARARLAKLTPVAKLAKWYASGYVTDAFVVARMGAIGYTPESIALHLEEFRGQRAKAVAAKNGQAEGQPKA